MLIRRRVWDVIRPGGISHQASSFGREAERRARLHYRLRAYRVLDANVWAGGYELDLVLRRGRRLVFCEVKAKGGGRYGEPLEMVGPEKRRRLSREPRRGSPCIRSARGWRCASRASAFRAGGCRESVWYPDGCRGALSPNGRARQNGRETRVRRPRPMNWREKPSAVRATSVQPKGVP